MTAATTFGDSASTLPAHLTFGDRLRHARVSIDMRQDILAAHVGVTNAAVSTWECDNHRPDFDRLERLATTLRVSLDWLVCGQRASAPTTDRLAPSTPAERTLLARFRQWSPTRQAALLLALDLPLEEAAAGAHDHTAAPSNHP